MAARRNQATILMDQTKKKLKLKSDYALAKYLDVHPSKVSSEVRTGKRTLQMHMIYEMCLVLDKDFIAQLIKLELEREKDKKIRRYWFAALKGRTWRVGEQAILKDEQPSATETEGEIK